MPVAVCDERMATGLFVLYYLHNKTEYRYAQSVQMAQKPIDKVRILVYTLKCVFVYIYSNRLTNMEVW